MTDKIETGRVDVSSFGDTLKRNHGEMVVSRNVEESVLTTEEAQRIIDSAKMKEIEKGGVVGAAMELVIKGAGQRQSDN
jgi:hypothetical protein